MAKLPIRSLRMGARQARATPAPGASANETTSAADKPAGAAKASPPRAKAGSHHTPQAKPTAVQLPGERVDTSYLESLIGYNARRAALAVIGVFLERMAVYQLRPVDFSALSLIHHNAGITSRQLCSELGILPPNLVGIINSFERRSLVVRRPHPNDGRAQGLHMTPTGDALMLQAEATASALEQDVASKLSNAEQKNLMKLLQKVYL
jgi:DNA-binding MarR family transcriptional regulator